MKKRRLTWPEHASEHEHDPVQTPKSPTSIFSLSRGKNTNTNTSTGAVTKITDVDLQLFKRGGVEPSQQPEHEHDQNCPVSNTKTNPRLDQEQHYRHIKLSHVSKSAVCGVSPETSIVPYSHHNLRKRESKIYLKFSS
jgi:hypothetical protein